MGEGVEVGGSDTRMRRGHKINSNFISKSMSSWIIWLLLLLSKPNIIALFAISQQAFSATYIENSAKMLITIGFKRKYCCNKRCLVETYRTNCFLIDDNTLLFYMLLILWERGGFYQLIEDERIIHSIVVQHTDKRMCKQRRKITGS